MLDEMRRETKIATGRKHGCQELGKEKTSHHSTMNQEKLFFWLHHGDCADDFFLLGFLLL